MQPLVARMKGNIMAPSRRPPRPPSTPPPLAWNPLAPKQVTKNDWGDFDPLNEITALKVIGWTVFYLSAVIHCTIISLFVTCSSRFHDTHHTHLWLSQGTRSVVDHQIDQDPLVVVSSAVWMTVCGRISGANLHSGGLNRYSRLFGMPNGHHG